MSDDGGIHDQVRDEARVEREYDPELELDSPRRGKRARYPRDPEEFEYEDLNDYTRYGARRAGS